MMTRRKFLTLAGLALPAPLVADACLEPTDLRITELPLNKNGGVRFVHFTDFHFKGDTAYAAKVIHAINELRPDFVAFTGDLVEDKRYAAAALDFIRAIKAPVYGSPGNHEYRSGVDFAGNKVPYGGAPDLGAFEQAPPPAAARPGLVARIAVPRTMRRSLLIARGLAGAGSANLPSRFQIFLGFSPGDARRLRMSGRKRHGMIVISVKTANIAGPPTQAVRITLSRVAARRLRRAAHIPVTLRLQVEVTTSDGQATLVRRSIRLLAT